MKLSQLKTIVKEAVKEAIQEEMKEILIEAVRAPKQVVQEVENRRQWLDLVDISPPADHQY